MTPTRFDQLLQPRPGCWLRITFLSGLCAIGCAGPLPWKDAKQLAVEKERYGLTADQQASLQAAADEAAEFGRQNQLKKEQELVSFLEEQGMEIYEPDVAAFRERVQSMYLESEYANDWPEGLLDKINALGG